MKIIETDRMYLRKFSKNDVEKVSVIYSDEDVMRYIGRGGGVDKKQTGFMLVMVVFTTLSFLLINYRFIQRKKIRIEQ